MEAEPRHETLLVENERVDVVLEGQRGHRPRLARVDDDNARADADFPAIAAVQILKRLVVHQKQHIAERLHAGLQAIGRRHGIIVRDKLAVPQQRPLTVVPADDEAGLDDVGKHQDARSLLRERLRHAFLGIELIQCGISVSHDDITRKRRMNLSGA